MKKKLLLSILCVICYLSVSAVDIYVSPTTGSDTNNGSKSAPFKTIETAVYAVKDNTQTNIYIEKNSIIKLGAVLNFGENKKVTIYGQGSTLKADDLAAQKDPSGLPLLGQGNRIMRATTGCDLKISRLTFQNGRQVGYLLGGGLYFAGNTLEIDSCKFIDNQAGSSGGAIAARAKSVTVKNSYFQGNNILGGGARGAAIMQCGPASGTPGTLVVQNCTFYQNITQVGGSGMAINIFDSTEGSNGGKYTNMGNVQVTNCTFIENSSVTAYQAAIDVSDGDCNVYLTNNTFYKNTDGGFRLGFNKAYLANNVIVGGKQGILSETSVAEGRPEMVGVNNISIGTEGGKNQGIDDACFTTDIASYKNTVSTITAYPISNLGLATSLSTDNFVPYLAIVSASSTLIDAGTDDNSLLFGTNTVPATDCRNYSKSGKKDIGAFEYNGTSGITSNTITDNQYVVSKAAGVITISHSESNEFTLKLVDLSGKIILSNGKGAAQTLSPNQFGKGVYLLILNDGKNVVSQKIVF